MKRIVRLTIEIPEGVREVVGARARVAGVSVSEWCVGWLREGIQRTATDGERVMAERMANVEGALGELRVVVARHEGMWQGLPQWMAKRFGAKRRA